VTSKTAKKYKKVIAHQNLAYYVNAPLSNITFFVILHKYLQFYYISAAVTCYRVLVRSSNPTTLGSTVVQPAPIRLRTKVVIGTYSPNLSCEPNLKLLE